MPSGKPGARAVRLIRPRSRVRLPIVLRDVPLEGLAIDARHLARGPTVPAERPTRERPSGHTARSAPASASLTSTRGPGSPGTSRTGAQLDDAERDPGQHWRGVREHFNGIHVDPNSTGTN